MKTKVIDNKGNDIENIELDKKVFGQDENPDLLAQYIHIFRTNQRQGTSATKTRAFVRGGGKKPWRQKGTGRARHGSIRSPIWVGGGVAHGPEPKEYVKKMPRKMRKKAMQCALSARFKEGRIKVIDKLEFKEPSTKTMAEILKSAGLDEKSLIVLEKADTAVLKSASNLPFVNVVVGDALNVYEVLDVKNILMEKGALLNLQKKYK